MKPKERFSEAIHYADWWNRKSPMCDRGCDCTNCVTSAALTFYASRHEDLVEALEALRAACEEQYKAGRIAAEPFVRAGNVLAEANR